MSYGASPTEAYHQAGVYRRRRLCSQLPGPRPARRQHSGGRWHGDRPEVGAGSCRDPADRDAGDRLRPHRSWLREEPLRVRPGTSLASSCGRSNSLLNGFTWSKMRFPTCARRPCSGTGVSADQFRAAQSAAPAFGVHRVAHLNGHRTMTITNPMPRRIDWKSRVKNASNTFSTSMSGFKVRVLVRPCPHAFMSTRTGPRADKVVTRHPFVQPDLMRLTKPSQDREWRTHLEQ
jgi:hypothetical protein